MLGAKNAVLKQMAATLLAPGRHCLHNVPRIQDVHLMGRLLDHLGAQVNHEDTQLNIIIPTELNPEAPLDLVRAMRASIVTLGPLLARTGQAQIPLPGGDDLGSRPIDWHLSGLEKMGASFDLVHGVLHGRVTGRLQGQEIELPFPSVGATENLILAAVLAEGMTAIVNAAREPEIVDLVEQIRLMGGQIHGVGTSLIRVEGVTELYPAERMVIPDRVEAGTYAIAAAITGGDVTITSCNSTHIRMEINKLSDTGCQIETGEGWLRVQGPDRPQPVDFATLPYPGFHTDLHPQMVALLTVASGTSIVTENLYDARFRYVGELARMGANILTEWQHAVIRGVETLSGAPVIAPDIRAGAALVLAGLRAEGETVVSGAHHIERGYQDFVGSLSGLGAQIYYIPNN